MEAFPGSADDSCLKRGAYIAEFDLLCPMVVVSLLVDIYCRRVTRLHLGPPCVTWGTLYQNLCGGSRSAERWEGSLLDVKEILGNRTAGVTFLLLRAIWEMRGVASWEHPLSSMMLRLRCCHALLGLPHVHKTRIDQCAFNLCPGDCRFKRYLKPTAIATVGCQHFPERRCNVNMSTFKS